MMHQRRLTIFKPVRRDAKIIFLIIIILLSCNKSERLRKEGKITSGIIYETSSGGRFGGKLTLRYKYSVNGHEYKSSTSYGKLVFTQGFLFLNKKFPVLYLEENPSNSPILVDRYDFKYYGYLYPDSLLWVVELEK